MDEQVGEISNISPIMPINDYDEIAELKNFLKRPVLIDQRSVAIGGTANNVIKPWQLFCQAAPVRRKLDNFAFIKAKLHLKFIINASPFHYGVFLAAYKPLDGFFLPSGPPSATEARRIVTLSQCQNVYLYPQTCQGAEMVLPYINHQEWAELKTGTGEFMSRFGSLYVVTPIPLRFANTGTGPPVDYAIYAWMEDVELAGPSRSQLQSGIMEAVNAKMASAASGAISGLCIEPKPVAKRFMNTALALSANSTGDIPAESLTLDPDAKTGIANDALKTDVDQMDITTFCKRETWLTYFDWLISSGPNSNLFTMNITPWMFSPAAESQSNYELATTPLFMCAHAFDLWRGGIKVRLKFLCSQYHRGRVRVQWDPFGPNSTLNVDDNVILYNAIVDLSENTDVTFTIPWIQALAWKSTSTHTYPFHQPNQPTKCYEFGTTALSYNPNLFNGQLTVKVLNVLTAPTNTANIEVAVLVSAADDIEFNKPSALDKDARLFFNRVITTGTLPVPIPQSGRCDIQGYDTTAKTVDLAPPTKPPDALYHNYSGDRIKSIKAYIQRLSLTKYHQFDGNFSAVGMITQNIFDQRLPPPAGILPGPANVIPTPEGAGTTEYGVNTYITPVNQDAPFQPVWTPLSWFATCYLGCRGGVQHALYQMNTLNTVGPKLFIRRLCEANTTSNSRAAAEVVTISASALNETLANTQYDFATGGAVDSPYPNPVVRVIAPYYSKYKFRQCSPSLPMGVNYDDSRFDRLVFEYCSLGNSAFSSTFTPVVMHFTGAAADFVLLYFMHTPVLHYSRNVI